MVTDNDGDTIEARNVAPRCVCIAVQEGGQAAAVILTEEQAEALIEEVKAALNGSKG